MRIRQHAWTLLLNDGTKARVDAPTSREAVRSWCAENGKATTFVYMVTRKDGKWISERHWR